MITIDGWITIGTKLSTDKFDKQMSDLENKIDSEEKKQELLNNKTKEYESDLRNATRQVNELAKEYDNATAKAEELANAMRTTPKGSFQRMQLADEYNEQARKVDELSAKLDKAEKSQSNLQRRVTQTKLQYENSGKAVDRLRGKISQVNLKRQQYEFKEVERSTNRIKDGIQNTIGKIGKMAMAVLGVRSAFMLLRQASSTWAQYNEQYAKDLEYIRFALASGIAPILEKIVSLAQTLMAYVNYLSNAWFGKTIFASAKDFEKMQKSASGVAKSTKEIKNNLAGFDELNVLSSNQDAGGAGGGVTAPSIDIEEVEIPKWLIWIKDNGELIRDILIGIGSAIAGIKLAKLLSSLGLISEKLISIKALGIGAMIYGIVDGIRSLIKYLKDPSYENFGNMIKDIGIAIIGLGALLGSVPVAIAGAGVLILGIVIKYWEQIKEFLQNGIDWLRGLGDKIEEIFGKPIRVLYDTVLNILQIILNTFDSTFEAIKGIFDGFIMFIKGVFTGDWEMAWEGIKTIFSSTWNGIVGIVKGAINIVITLINGMLAGLEAGLNWVIEKINLLSFEVPDWIPGIGGQVWGFNLPKFSFGRIPLLARGGIVAKPTQAIIGEAGREAVMPLDNNTEWMDLLADRLSERLGTGAGEQEVTIRFEGTMAQFVRELKPHIEVENKRAGTRIITGGAY